MTLKLGYNTGYWPAGPPVGALDAIKQAEALGYESFWTAEAYGSDALTPLAWWGAQTSTIKLGTGIVQISARTPSATAMAAITLDHLSGGRLILGLGVSGPQVVEGWYVGRADMAGAISLNSAAINLSRVVGPVLAGVLYPVLGAGWLYIINAVTFLFVIVALVRIRLPALATTKAEGFAQLAVGFRVVRADPVLRRVLLTMTLFSFFCLPFISLWSTVARVHVGLSSARSIGTLYAVFGVGALLGSLAVGSVLTRFDRRLVSQLGLAGFALMIGVIALAGHNLVLDYPAFFVLGGCYFATTTSLLTVLQSRVADSVRGRVMALWFMSFGGTVSLCGPVFGPLLDHTSGALVLGLGAVCAAVLAWWCNLARVERTLVRSTGLDDDGGTTMIRVSVMYPKAEGSTFDLDYYKTTHMAIVKDVMPGLLRTEVDQAIDGPYMAVGHLYFDSAEVMGAAMGSPDVGKAMADIPNFTNATPVMQVAQVLG